MRTLSLCLMGIAFLLNAYGLYNFIAAAIDVGLHPDPKAVGSFWQWGLVWAVVPGVLTLLGLGFGFVVVLRRR